MAAYHERSGSPTTYNGGSGGEQLPTGCCNYRDLAIGAQAPVCGCKKFWMNSGYNNGQEHRTWCFCGHHACYHDFFSPIRGLSQVSNIGLPATEPANAPVENVHQQAGHSTRSQTNPTGLGIRPELPAASRSIDTRLWTALNAFACEQAEGPQSDTTSKLPSTACPSLADEPRASPSRMMRERLQYQRPMGPPIKIPHIDQNPGSAEDYSATEVATPSANGTPDLQRIQVVGPVTRLSPPTMLQSARRPLPAITRDPQTSMPSGSPLARLVRPQQYDVSLSTHEQAEMLQSLSRRMDVLEGLSFSHVPLEEVQDRFELHDGRLLDLEQWRANPDRGRSSPETAGPSEPKKRRLLPSEDGSLSDDSFDSVAAAQTETAILATLAANAESGPRIDALERRVLDLEECSLPSFNRPWQVQVVLLPWSRSLCGIWFSALDATQHSLRTSTQASGEWTRTQPTQKLSFQSATSAAWTTESIQAWANDAQGWLSPKACGPYSTVFQRLASRGMVRDVTLKAPDARHVFGIISDAFDPRLRTEPASSSHDHLGLTETFVPLRKIRKSSRLRYLSPAEMVTPAMWTASFLDASVFMRLTDGHRRLYITTPGAYLQNEDGQYSWPELRRWPIYNASGEEHDAQMTGAAIEECWTYNEHLDRAVSMQASFAGSHASCWGTDDQLRGARIDETDLEDHTLGKRHLALPGPTSGPHRRTVSLPSSSSLPEHEDTALPKRRVTSFATVSSMPVSMHDAPTIAGAKRRRISTSPEAERHGVGLTPRLSREPPSPFMSAGEVPSQGNSSVRRGTTPFAYATPHSNSNFIGRVEGQDFSCGDTEADTDMAVPQSEAAMEDEWHGVDEDELQLDALDRGSAVDEAEIDEENPE